MQARFLLGPAGSGKSHRCLAEIAAELKASPEGLPLVLLAPKQATFQLERQLLAGPDLPGYSRLQIVSFERLAESVLAEFWETKPTDGPTLSASKKRNKHSAAQREFPFWEQASAPPAGSARESASRDSSIQDTFQPLSGPQEFLDEEGRVMVLRALLAQKQKELKIYRATARLPGFAQQLSLLLRELQRHQQSPERLFSLATQVDPQLADKLHDLALLLRAYHDWLKTHRLQDANRLLDLATETLRVQTAQRNGSLRLGGLWLDGFAEMTPQELDFLARLAPLCPRATLAFCLENEPAGNLSLLSTWSVVGKTFQQSYQRLATLAGCEVEVEILPRKRDRGRFAASPVLAHLEANWSRPKPFEPGPVVSERQEATAMARGDPEPTPNSSREGSLFSRSAAVLGSSNVSPPNAQDHCQISPARKAAAPEDGRTPLIGSQKGNRQGCPGVPDALRIAVCPNPDAEIVLAAREILRHVRAGGRYRDCAVLLRTHAGYHDTLRRVFQRYEIPFFLDRREPVTHHPLAELTRYAIRTVALNWEHDDWFGALKTGLVPGEEAAFDALENQALARGWKADTWKQPLRIPDDESLEKRLEHLRTNIVPPFQRLARRLASDKTALQSPPTGSQLAEAVRQLWAELEVEETLEQWSVSEPGRAAGRSPHSRIHSTVLRQMQSWLDNVALAFPDKPLPLRDWLPILEAGLAGLTVGVIPPALDHVLVGTIDRSRNPELELALVLGLNESVFPAVPQMAGLLSETDRERLETIGVVLGPNKLAQLGHERYYGYVACTRARRRLVLTCAQRDANDRALNPSPFLAHVKCLFPSLEIPICPEPEHWLASEHACELQAPLLHRPNPGADASNQTIDLLPPANEFPSPGLQPSPPPPKAGERAGRGGASWSLWSLASLPAFAPLREQLHALASYAPSDAFSPALAEQLFGPELRTSVSALEHFAACPFKFFVHFGLRAEERRFFEADAREQGSYQHRVLAQFHEELEQEGKRWRDLTPQEARTRIGRIARQVADDFREGLFSASDPNRFAALSLARTLEDFIETVIEWMPDYGFDPRSVELAFDDNEGALPAWEIHLENGHSLVIRGKIDRVDLVVNPAREEALCAVIDYKSGVKKIDPLLLEHGIQIQLPAYLAALRRVADPHPVFGVRRLVPAGVFYVSLRGSYKAGVNRRVVLDGAREARLLAHRHAGRFRSDALGQFDRRAPAGNSGQFNYALTNQGKPNKQFADLLEAGEFNALLDRVENRLREMGRRIFTGDARVDPYLKGAKVACDFCDSRAICRIDPWTHPFRALKKISTATQPP